MALPSTGKKATATPSNPGSALTDFTFIIDLSDMPQAWWDDVNTTDGTRGRSAKNDETTELATDWIDFNSTAQTGQVCIMYTGTKSASVSEPVIIYPPNTRNTAYSASDTYGQYNAYNSNVVQYLPFEGDLLDRSGNGADADNVTGSYSFISGQIGDCVDLASASYLTTATGALSFSNESIQISAWVRPSLDNTVYGSRLGSEVVFRRTGSKIQFILNSFSSNDRVTSVSDLTSNAWHHVVGRYNGTTLDIFIDGELDASVTPSGSWGTLTQSSVGAFNGGDPWDAPLEEIKLLQGYESDDFISYEYSQTSDNSTFWGTWTVSDVSGGAALSGLSTTNSNATGSIDLLIDLIGLSSTSSTGSGDLVQLLELAGQSNTLSTAIGQISVSGLVQIAGVSTTESDISGQLNILLALSGIATTESIGQASINQLVSLIGQSTTESEAHGIIKQVAELIARATTEATGQGYISVIDFDVQLSGTSVTESIGRGLLELLDTLLFTETYDSIWSDKETYTSVWLDKEIYNSVIGGN